MTIYGLYIFDRHCTCTFYASYNGKVPRAGPLTLPNVFRSSTSTAIPTAQVPSWDRGSAGPPGLAAEVSGNMTGQGISATPSDGAKAGLAFDQEERLIFGLVYSLRNMAKKLGGRDDSFHSFSTSAYKLHYMCTPTATHFVLVTSPMSESLRFVLRQIYTGAYTDFVVRNPLIDVDSKQSGKGIDNDAFRAAVEKTLKALPVF